uniref:Nuclear pore complex protein n=1 Tax=Plectus sambesii TaxID=2011161 RepID=A0A914XPF3_9BILA
MDMSLMSTRSAGNRSRFGADGENNATMNFTTANFDLFMDENAAVKVSETLFEDFSSALMETQGSSKVFTLVANFEQLCEDMSTILSKVVERASGSDMQVEQAMSVMQQVKSERFAWRLLRQLYEDRIDRQPQDLLEGVDIQADSAPDDRSVYGLLLRTDRQFRELTLILKWCEEVAAEQLNDANTLAAFASKLVLWQNTLHNRKRGGAGCDMDPDGPLREGQSLDSYDENDDVKLISVIFSYVRCGQIQKAIDLCVHCGQSWRAALLQGKLLASDPNLTNNDGSALSKTGGNRRRPLWKSACWKASENPGLSLVERSLLAALGGRLGPLLTVCRQWDDRLWAYVTASVEYQLSSALHRLGRCPSPSDTTGIDLADFTLDSIHQELSASEDSDSDAYQQICKFIMLDDPDNAVAFMYEWLADR